MRYRPHYHGRNAFMEDAVIKYEPKHAKPVSEQGAASGGPRVLAALGKRPVGRHAAPQRQEGTAVPEKSRALTATVA
jgi:hypothetical protein